METKCNNLSHNLHSLYEAQNEKTLYNSYFDKGSQSIKQYSGFFHFLSYVKRIFKWMIGQQKTYLNQRYTQLFNDIIQNVKMLPEDFNFWENKKSLAKKIIIESDHLDWSILTLGELGPLVLKIAKQNKGFSDGLLEGIEEHTKNPLTAYLEQALKQEPKPPENKEPKPPENKEPKPPENGEPSKAKIEKQKWQKLLERSFQGENPAVLLKEAFDKKLPAFALSLAQKTKSLEGLNQENDKPLYQWLEDNLNKPAPSPETLDHFALNLGYGYKSANLLVLEEQTAQISKGMVSSVVKVPPFLPISHIEMKMHLGQTIPLDDLWKEFLDSFDKDIKKQFLQKEPNTAPVPLKISPQGISILKKIESQIQSHFEEDPYVSPQIEQWLRENPTQFVIVRSTGKEDTENNANAGGNDSIPFVAANASAISQAMSRVITSYFGEKSITQRLNAQDTSVFAEPPFMPVLIQKMVMEKNEGAGSTAFDIPRSGVLLTREPGKADDITLIQVGLGNNEGVVTSQVAVDSYMVDAQGHIHSAIREKKTRFVNAFDNQKKRYEAKQIDNRNDFLIKKPALTEDVIRDIKKMSDHVATYYGQGQIKPMDMEFSVVLPSKKQYIASTQDKTLPAPRATIYLLQARPLQLSKNEGKKSYIDLDYIKKLSKSSVLKAETLIEGQGNTRSITTDNEILFVQNLAQGLKQYLDAPDPSKIKLIVSAKTDASTSHEAVTLRPKGVVVMVIEDEEKYNALHTLANKKSAQTPLVVDPQRGIIMLANTAEAAEKAGREGFISYPIQRQLSTKPGPVARTRMELHRLSSFPRITPKEQAIINHLKLGFTAEYAALDSQYVTVQKQLESDVSLDKKSSIPDLFDIIATKEQAEAKQALSIILQRLKKNMQHHAKKHSVEVYGYALDAFEQIVHHCNDELVPALLTYPPQHPKRLFALKILECLIFQEDGHSLVSWVSFAQVKKLAKCKALALGQEKRAKAHLEAVATYAFSNGVKKKWISFIASLSDEQANRLFQSVTKLNENNLFSSWLNMQFSKQFQTDFSTVIALEDDIKKIQALFDKFAKLKTLKSTIANWSNPEYFNKNFAKALEGTFLTEFGFSGAFVDEYKNANAFRRMVLVEFMQQSVTVYDQTIKAVSGSDQFSDTPSKVSAFHKILTPYFTMMQTSLRLVENREKELMSVKMGHPYTFILYNEKLNSSFSKIPKDLSEDQFKARPEFQVGALVVGSHTDLDFHVAWPKSAEEHFTTFHQNMEQIARIIKLEQGMSEEILPEYIREKHIKALKITFDEKAKLSSISVDEKGEITITYAVPLRQHAGFIHLKFSPSKPNSAVTYVVEITGNDECNRWDMAASIAALIAHKKAATEPCIRFTKDQAPTISYGISSRSGVQFSLDVPSAYNEVIDFNCWIERIFFRICFDYRPNGDSLINECKKYKILSGLESLEPEAFRDGFFMNAAALRYFDDRKEYATLGKVAANTLIGFARYGISDYTRLENESVRVEGYTGHADYAYVPGNKTGSFNTQLKLAAVLWLIKSLEKDTTMQSRTTVKKLLENVEFKNKFPEIATALNQSLIKLKTPEEQLAYHLDQKNIAQAKIMTFHNTALSAQHVDAAIANMVENDQKEFVHVLIIIVGLGEKGLMESLVKQYRAKLSAETLNHIEKLNGTEIAMQYLKQINSIASTIQQLSSQFDTEYESLFKSIAKGLIGLSRSSEFSVQSFGSFEHLDGLLGNQVKYGYVYDNKYGDTTKLRKAGPLYLIKGLEHANASIRQKAYETMVELLNDYRYFSNDMPTQADVQKALAAIITGYLSYYPKEERQAKIAALNALYNEAGNVQQLIQQASGAIP